MDSITDQLKRLQDEKYKHFQSALLPTVDPDTVLGVRIPDLRKLAKKLKDTEEAEQFLHSLPHATYDENNLHAFLIDQQCHDYESALSTVEEFLPYVDNWATCDSFTVRALLKDRDRLKEQCLKWMDSDHPYTVRYGIVTQLKYFISREFDPEVLKKVVTLHSDHYYVRMAQAWYLSMTLIEQQEVTVPYFQSGQCDVWVHNKALQKACESLKSTEEQRKLYRQLKRKPEVE